MRGDPVTHVRYIIGTAHSGSTLLAALLDELPGHTSAAETRMIWAGIEQRRCGCGDGLLVCPLWGPSLAATAEAAGHGSVEALAAAMRRDRVTVADLPRLLWARGRASRLPPRLVRYGTALSRLYAELAERTDEDTVVDSSKSTAEALLLQTLGLVELHLVHLVRDPRSVALSGTRSASGKDFRRDKSFVERSARYLLVNGAAERAARRFAPDRYTRVRYEDLVEDPDAVLEELTGITRAAGRGRRPRRHLAGGNRLRFEAGPIVIHPAERAWPEQLSPTARWITSHVTHRARRRYGYAAAALPSEGQRPHQEARHLRP